MFMHFLYGVEIQVPAGKLPGFYAQVIHKIGDNVNVFDRDGQLFIVETKEDRDKLEAILSRSGMLGDVFSLLLLPAEADVPDPEDCGFVSQAEHVYLYADRVALFTVQEQVGTKQDQWAAQEQWNEHLLGKVPAASDHPAISIIDTNLAPLADRIAQAYRTEIRWLHRG